MAIKTMVKKSRKFMVLLLVFLAFAVSSTTYAYWASSVSASSAVSASNSVTIGSGDAVTTTVTINSVGDNGPAGLVPSSVTGTHAIIFTFSVTWSDTGTLAEGTTGTLSAAVTGASGGTGFALSDYNDMFVTTDSGSAITMDGTVTDFTVTVTFTNEPSSKAQYDKLAGQTISLDITITATAD